MRVAPLWEVEFSVVPGKPGEPTERLKPAATGRRPRASLLQLPATLRAWGEAGDRLNCALCRVPQIARTAYCCPDGQDACETCANQFFIQANKQFRLRQTRGPEIEKNNAAVADAITQATAYGPILAAVWARNAGVRMRAERIAATNGLELPPEPAHPAPGVVLLPVPKAVPTVKSEPKPAQVASAPGPLGWPTEHLAFVDTVNYVRGSRWGQRMFGCQCMHS